MNATRAGKMALLTALISALVVVVAGCVSSAPAPSPSPSSPAAKASSPSPSPSTSTSPASSPASSAAGSSAEQAAYQKAMQEWPQVLEAARKEGTAMLYSVSDTDTLKDYEQAFNKIDPKIQIKFVFITGAAVTERIKGEQSTKQYNTNLYMGGTPATRDMVRLGLAQMVDLPVLHEPGVQWLVSPLFDSGKETIVYGFSPHAIIYNTSLVPAGQEPRTWKDLGDPRWKDKLAGWEPRIASTTRAVLSLLYLSPNHGPDVVRKIVDNMRVVQNNTEVARMVARGEMALGILPWSSYPPVKDAPVKILVHPEDGMSTSTLQAVAIKNAPQPNITKVFLNWVLGKEGQKVVSTSMGALRQDVDTVNKEIQAVGRKLLPNAPSSWDFESTKMEEAAKVYGKWLDEQGK